MSKFNRRDFLKIAGLAGVAASLPLIAGRASAAATKARVVVIGGGPGGATAAKYIRKADPSIEVTLIERNQHYHTCFMSNEVLAGVRSLDSIKFGYDGLAKHGVKVVHDTVTGVDPVAKKVTTQGGQTFAYDRLVVSPGIDFQWGAIEGYDEAASEIMPHAWKAGPQTALLRKQLEAMRDGGTVIMVAPPNPFRCPPGPYERASLIAHYLKHHKPKSKIIILDAKDSFSKQGLFTQGWELYYKGMIEWVSGAQGGKVEGVDPKTMTVKALLENFKGDVVNVIPPQKAGNIAHVADLVDEKGWCPVNKKTFESTKHKDIHVIGDASIATDMPKSGYAANSQAKVAALAIVDALNGREPGTPSYVNTCYSLIAPDYGISVAAVYRLEVGGDGVQKIVQTAGGLSPKDASPEVRKREVAYAYSWFANLTHDMFG